MSQLVTTAALIHAALNITFWVNEAKANKAGKLPVSMRLTIHGKRAEVSTGIRCLPREWNKDKKRLVSVKWDDEKQAYCLLPKPTNATKQLNTLLDDLEARTRLLASDMRQHVTPGRPVTARALRAKLLCPNPEAAPEPCALVLLEEAALTYANLSTRSAGGCAIRMLRRFIAPATTLLLTDFTPAFCLKLESWMGEQTSLPTANGYTERLRALFGRALPDLRNPFTARRTRNTAPVKPRYVLSREELATLENVELPTHTARVARDIYMAQYYLHGSRVGAVLTLPWEQVDWERGRVRFKAEKGGDWHNVALRPQLAAILRRYYAPGAIGPIFPLLPANYASRPAAERFKLRKKANTQVWAGLQVASKLLNLPGKLHSHTARHTLATHTVQATGSYHLAQQLLGHSSLAMTEKYVRSMLPEETDVAADAVYGTVAQAQGGKVIPLFGRVA
jgi:integrase